MQKFPRMRMGKSAFQRHQQFKKTSVPFLPHIAVYMKHSLLNRYEMMAKHRKRSVCSLQLKCNSKQRNPVHPWQLISNIQLNFPRNSHSLPAPEARCYDSNQLPRTNAHVAALWQRTSANPDRATWSPLLTKLFDPSPDNAFSHAARNQSSAYTALHGIRMYDCPFLNSQVL